MFELTDRVALVTGAGRNVGAGIALALATQGAAVGVNDFHHDRAEEVAGDIRAAGGRAIPVAFDVTDLDAVRAGFDDLASQFGPVDVLVNNAGTGGPTEPMRMAAFADLDPDYWDPIVRVNLFGPMNCCRVAVGPMIKRGFGRVITISSGAGQTGMNIGVSPYAAAKAGAAGFMRHFAVENADKGITANTISLGLVLDDPSVAELVQMIPVGRLGKPSDVGALAVYLASNEASWITGQTIGLNGGQLAI